MSSIVPNLVTAAADPTSAETMRLEMVRILMERANHVEQLLVGSLLGFFLTATAGGFIAAYTLRGDAEAASGRTRRHFFLGVVAMYGFVSGFYYYMLAQFYAAIIAVVEVAKGVPGLPLHVLTRTLQFPTPSIPGPWEDNLANVAMLAVAPLFPVLLSTTLIYGFYRYLRMHDAGCLRPRHMIAAIIGHVFLCVFVLGHPFIELIRATGTIEK